METRATKISENLQIRRAVREDVAAIVSLYADDPLGSQREQIAAPLPQTYYDAFEAINADANHALVVAERNGEIVGTLQFTLIPNLNRQGGKRAQIEAVHIASSVRGQGVGSLLMQWAIDLARAENCCLVQLTSNTKRPDAHRFYARLGFVPSHVGMKLEL